MSGSRTFDFLEDRLAWLARRSPRLALSAAGWLGQVRNRLSGRWPNPEQVRTLFPGLGRGAAARLAWRIGGLEARNRLLVSCLRRAGADPIRPLVRCPAAFTALRPPVILGTFHLGAIHALGAAVEQLSAPVLTLRMGRLYEPRPPVVEVATTEGTEQNRAALFRRLLLHLNQGGFILAALDVAPGASIPTTCFGRPLALARGPFALARLTGAPLRPLVARWRGGRIEVVMGEPLVPDFPADTEAGADAWESALAASAVRWLESYLLGAPGELGLGLLRMLLRPETGAS